MKKQTVVGKHDDFQMMEKYFLVKLIIKKQNLRQCQFQQTREWIQLTYIKLLVFT